MQNIESLYLRKGWCDFMPSDSQTQVNQSPNRLYFLDFLKVIGLTGIMIAHAKAPDWLMMLRSFDVPLLVIISSILARISYDKYENHDFKSACKFVFSRIKRLVIPTWIFLTIYFLLFWLFTGQLHNLSYYIASYCLTRYGIGFVWVILIYIYSAILVPIFSKLKISFWSIAIIATIYLLFEVGYYFQIGTTNKFIETTFYYIVPYGVLTFLGYNYKSFSTKTRYLITFISFFIFAMLGGYYWIVNNSPQIVQIAKYPPRLYYLSYGVFCSFALLILCEKHNFSIFMNPIIRFISNHSMWIYLWHIMILAVYNELRLPSYWMIKLFIVYCLALLVVHVINLILDLFDKKGTIKFFNYFRG